MLAVTRISPYKHVSYSTVSRADVNPVKSLDTEGDLTKMMPFVIHSREPVNNVLLHIFERVVAFPIEVGIVEIRLLTS